MILSFDIFNFCQVFLRESAQELQDRHLVKKNRKDIDKIKSY